MSGGVARTGMGGPGLPTALRQRACDLADAAHTTAVDLGAGAIERDARNLLASIGMENDRSTL